MWFRRDFRLTDNPALAAAQASGAPVRGIVVRDDALLHRAGAHRRQHFESTIEAFADLCHGTGVTLEILDGPAVDAVSQACRGASALYANADVSRSARRRDRLVHDRIDCPFHTEWGNLVHHPRAVLTGKGTVSRVFTPFHRTWRETPWAPRPDGEGPARFATLPLAAEALDRALDRAEAYPDRRDLPAIAGSTELSPHLHLGTLGARQVCLALDERARTQPSAAAGAAALTRQLAWRDWYAHLLWEIPNLSTHAQQPKYDALAYSGDRDAFDAWCAGQTGYPIVDAGMRQLAATGWMHNRVRMIAGSFLVKQLLCDWRWGERWFRNRLIDGEISQNVGNWQWVAGVGPDAAPYFRIFNPVTQGQKFDPDGGYVRQWVPELSAMAARWIHRPWMAPERDRIAADVTLGSTYPRPIVDLAEARARALAAYGAV